jgi:hypothetical protein
MLITNYYLGKFEVLTAVMTTLFFWVVTPCSLVGRYQRFGEIYSLHLQGWSGGAGEWRVYIGLEEGQAGIRPWYLPTSLHVVTIQNIVRLGTIWKGVVVFFLSTIPAFAWSGCWNPRNTSVRRLPYPRADKPRTWTRSTGANYRTATFGLVLLLKEITPWNRVLEEETWFIIMFTSAPLRPLSWAKWI